jgi:hypothetical protein
VINGRLSTVYGTQVKVSAGSMIYMFAVANIFTTGVYIPHSFLNPELLLPDAGRQLELLDVDSQCQY